MSVTEMLEGDTVCCGRVRNQLGVVASVVVHGGMGMMRRTGQSGEDHHLTP